MRLDGKPPRVLLERHKSFRQWRRVALAGTAAFLALFGWVQYAIYTSTVFDDDGAAASQHPTFLASGLVRRLRTEANRHGPQPESEDSPPYEEEDPEARDAVDPAVYSAHASLLSKTMTSLSEQDMEPQEDESAIPKPLEAESAVQRSRRLAVKQAMQFAWSNYEARAFGGDELGPVRGNNLSTIWGGMACTMVDALDTLWLMDLKVSRYCRSLVQKTNGGLIFDIGRVCARSGLRGRAAGFWCAGAPQRQDFRV